MKSLVDSLDRDERLLARTELSRVIYMTPIFLTTFFTLSSSWRSLELTHDPMVFSNLILMMMLFSPFWFWAWGNSRSSEFIVTNRRFIAKTGWRGKNITEIPLHVIRDVHIKQRFTGKGLGYGTLRFALRSGHTEQFLRVHLPERIVNAINDAQSEEVNQSSNEPSIPHVGFTHRIISTTPKSAQS